MRSASILALCLTLCTGLAAQARTHFWVDASNGADTNPGTKALPFKSIGKPLSLLKANAVVHILPGTYGPLTTGDFWDTTTNAAAKYNLAGYLNYKICGEDRDTCIIDFNGNTGIWYGYFDVGAGAQDVEICNLTFKNLGATPWGNSPININGDATRVNIHSNYFLDCMSTIIIWGGMDCAFHDNILESTQTLAATEVGVRIRTHYFNSTGKDNTYVYNNLLINLDHGIAFDNGPAGTPSLANQYVYNNIVVGTNLAFPNTTLPANLKFEHNYAFQCTTPFSATGISTTNVTNDPQFVDATKKDFRLKPSSPCIESGFTGFLLFECNDYAGNARGFDLNNDGLGQIDIGPYESVELSMSLVKGFEQGQTPEFAISATKPTIPLGFFVLSLGKSGSATMPIFHLDPFGTFGIDPTLILLQQFISVPNPNHRPVPAPIPVSTSLDGVEVYAQFFGYEPTSSGDRFKPSGRLDLNL